MKHLILTDDNPRDRGFLAETLQHYNPVLTANADEALNACIDDLEPWVVTDIQMPGGNGIELARKLWAEKPFARILFWSQHSDETYIRALLKLTPPETVYGYVLKNNPSDVLLRATQSVFDDCQCWIDPQIRSTQARTRRDCDSLSDAEYEVLIDIALGLTDSTIAERCYLSKRGVQNRLQSLYAKLGANLDSSLNHNHSELINIRTRAVSIALQRGLINAFELKHAEKLLSEWMIKQKKNN